MNAEELKDKLITETIKAYRDGYQAGFHTGLEEGKREMIAAVLAIIHTGDMEAMHAMLEKGAVS